jgi:hypothetical protein
MQAGAYQEWMKVRVSIGIGLWTGIYNTMMHAKERLTDTPSTCICFFSNFGGSGQSPPFSTL